MAEVRVWYGVGMWFCNLGCDGAFFARWNTSYGTKEAVAGQIADHIARVHPQRYRDLPLVKHGEWRADPHCDLTPAHG